jgi:VIT1/CCC1 family predicted Fe2+/Mn2+ transporter
MAEMEKIDPALLNRLLMEQQDEITAHCVYQDIAGFVKDEKNKQIIEQIAADEWKHYQLLKDLTGKELKPQKIKRAFYYWVIRIFGLTFGIKLMEKGESQAVREYGEVEEQLPGIYEISVDEERHEEELIDMLDEERLRYMGSIVLGLNDALVELTGALAGYTFAFQNTRLIALTGLITGISASFSMAASEYLSTRQDGGENAVKSSIYTGVAYVFTVIFLILPFLILENPFYALISTLMIAVLIIFLFNYYISVAKDYPFKRRFFEMAAISLGVAGISFLIGVLIKQFIGVDI